ncbi:MAG: hypothetical protein ACOCRX_10470 [Candidatus Woesearchaeota archaeon]
MSIEDEIKKQYLSIKENDNGSSYFNADFHIHSPGSSFDFTIDGALYKKLSKSDICQYAINNNYLKSEFINELNLNKDEIASLIIVKQAVKVGINLIVITDHNSMNWYGKIKSAVDALTPDYFIALPGVEITCYGGEHVIGIFDPDNYKTIWKNFKKEIEFKIEEGKDKVATNKSIPDLLKAIKKHGGITYLPHLDQNNLQEKIKGQTWIDILNDENLDMIGLNRLDKEDRVEYLKSKMDEETSIAFIWDSDAHSVNEIGSKYMKVKMQYPWFGNLKRAVFEHQLRIKLEKEVTHTDTYFNGLAIKSGFIKKSEDKWQTFSFNNDMNCIIGGRGTGKSTALNYLTFLFNKTESKDRLAFLSQADEIFIYFTIKNNSFCLRCRNIPVYYDEYSDQYTLKFGEEDGSDKAKISPGWSTLFKIDNNGNETKVRRHHDLPKKKIFENILPEVYSQTEIQSIAKQPDYFNTWFERYISDHEVNDTTFSKLNDQIEVDINYLKSKIHKVFNEGFNVNNLKERLESINDKIEERNKVVKIIIRKLNQILMDKVKLSFSEVKLNDFIKQLVFNIDENQNYKKHKLKTIKNHFHYFEQLEPLDFLIKIAKNNYEHIISETGLKLERDFDSFEEVEKDGFETEKDMLEYLYKILSRCKNKIIDYIKIPSITYKLELNVNSFKSDSRIRFRPLQRLSYGEKNIAILTLILEGFTEMGQDTPLIIDQPEDQLDNRYISENLVDDMRNVKGKRQLILVTHNPNIPICGDAENIFCMYSNGVHGWVKKNGALDKNSVMKFIAQNLEGGLKALQKRFINYKEFLDK